MSILRSRAFATPSIPPQTTPPRAPRMPLTMRAALATMRVAPPLGPEWFDPASQPQRPPRLRLVRREDRRDG